jgi:hypothetical protein
MSELIIIGIFVFLFLVAIGIGVYFYIDSKKISCDTVSCKTCDTVTGHCSECNTGYNIQGNNCVINKLCDK